VNSVAVFTWNGHLPNDDEVGADSESFYSNDFGEQWAYQACQPVALALLRAFRKRGLATDTDSPYYGEQGWHFVVRLESQSFSIMTLWIPRGDRNDAFAVQSTLCRSWLASLVLPRPDDTVLRPVYTVLNDLLKAHPQIADLEWVDKI
jgi:hypothetical protein